PALLQDRHVGDAVLPGEVVGGRQAVAAAAHDDDVVFGLRLGAAPRFLPALVVADGVAGKGEDRVAALQHSMTLTARPPREVSLYLRLMSRPVWRMVAITLSSETKCLPSPRMAMRAAL